MYLTEGVSAVGLQGVEAAEVGVPSAGYISVVSLGWPIPTLFGYEADGNVCYWMAVPISAMCEAEHAIAVLSCAHQGGLHVTPLAIGVGVG